MDKNMQQWITYAKLHQKSYYFYEGKVLDLTKFLFVHPGGRQVLQRYCFKDITDIIWTVFPHKKTETLMALQKYIIGSITNRDVKKRFSCQVSGSIMEHINFNNQNRRSVSFKINDVLMNFKINEQNKQDFNMELQKKQISPNNESKYIQKQNKFESNQIISQKLTQQVDKRKQISKRFFEIKVKRSKDNMTKQLQSQWQLNNATIDEDKLEFKVPILKTHHLHQP